jgi:hypothetical protein
MAVTGSGPPWQWLFTHLPEQLAGEAVYRVPKEASRCSANGKAIVMTGTALAHAINELVAMGSVTRAVLRPVEY